MSRIERVAILSIWMLHPNVPELITRLAKLDYITARVKPEHDTYTVNFLEPPGVIATKRAVRVQYEHGRRIITIEGSKPNEVIAVFNEIENALQDLGIDSSKATLYYEVQIRTKISGIKLLLNKIDLKDVLGFNLISAPTRYIIENGDPNTSKWFSLKLNPIWITWSSEEKKKEYDVAIVYRDEKEKLAKFVQNLDDILDKLYKKIFQG